MEQNGINNFASTILDFTTSIAKSEVDSAQYDKSFNTVIWGINQLFTEDVPQSVQEKLIKEHKIPEVSENYFYTFSIDGTYYVKESEIKFKLYQNVIVRVPNGNWNKMYIEGNGSDKEITNSSLSPLKDIKISTGKIEYNGEVYRLQRGNDRKIIAVSQGKKCTRIYASTEAESEAAAVSAVIHGLDEPWDIEFDYCVPNDDYSVTPFSAGDTRLNLSGSAVTEVDYGDGSETVINYSSGYHTIECKGYYRMRIKTTATKIVEFGGDYGNNWDSGKEVDPEKWKEGQRVYIGGSIRSVERLYGNAISHLTWGESVNYINNSNFVGSKTPLGFIDVGLPPYFISSIENFDTPANESHQILYESPVNYLYIPESCRRVFHIGFGGLPLKTLEIEPAGESLMLDPGSFEQYHTSKLKVVSIPARVKFRTGTSAYSPFDGGGIRVLHLQRGIQEIVSWSFIDCYSAGFYIGNSMIISSNGEVYIFIPKTVTSIKYAAFSFPSSSIINVIYEGNQYEWDEITKEKWWIRDREEPDNIAFGENAYNSFETLVDNLKDRYKSGTGIEVSDTISLKPATKDTLGGVKAGKSGSGIENSNGILSLEKADISILGGLRLGKGLYPSPTYSHNLGIVDVKLGKGLAFDTVDDQKDENYGKINVNLGKNLSFGENGEINAADGSDYTAGDGINISDTNIISINPASKTTIGGVKAGKNITILDDGTIAAEGTGNAELKAGGGITIETDEETGKQTISASVGEGAEIRDGKICTVPNIQNAVLITEADAKYLLHNFTEIEYNSGMQIGYAGPKNQIVVQKYLAFTSAIFQKDHYGGVSNFINYPETWVKPYSTYTELSGEFYNLNAGNTLGARFKKFSLDLSETRNDFMIYFLNQVGEDGSIVKRFNNSFYNYEAWSGLGIGIEWTNIFPPNSKLSDKIFEFGYVQAYIYGVSKNSKSSYMANRGYSAPYVIIPFLSMDEYNAAVGLTYEPLMLTEVTDNPTVVSR